MDGRPRILLAEDDPDIAPLLATFLEEEGYAVARASTGAEAAEAAEGGDLDLFLIDTLDAGATAGPSDELRSLLRRLSARAPVLVLTAHTWAGRADPAELGVGGIIHKPFDLDELLGTIRRLCP